MDIRDKTIKGLEECLSASCKGFKPGVYCPLPDEAWNYIRDAVVLLKEDERAIKFQSDRLDALLKAQEPVTPVQQPDDEYICGACGNGVVGCDVFDDAGIESVKNDYCPTCGRRVKWK